MLKLDGWIQKNKSLASTIGLIVGGALALTGIIGAIGLVARSVITGINAIIAAAGAMGGNLHDGWQCCYDHYRGD
ncbi:hypothetical protein O5623_05395 [Escherichia coli]|nr:hypothetical protein [Escherichia coli]